MMDKPELGTQNMRINARASRELYFSNKPAGILHHLPLIFYISLHSRTSTIFLHPKNTRANRSIWVDSHSPNPINPLKTPTIHLVEPIPLLTMYITSRY